MSVQATGATSAGTKRKASTAGLPGTTRPTKRRASKACHCCRSRKVRCDVVESGIPCTNCRLDEVECVVTEGKRRKKSYIEGDVLNQSPIESVEEQQEDLQKFPLFDDIDGHPDFPLLSDPTNCHHDGHHGANADIPQHRPHSIYQTQGQRMSPEERTRRISALGRIPKLSITPVQLPDHLQYRPQPRPSASTLPLFITPVPRHILGEDLEFLAKKGVFQLPDAGTRNELLRSYAQYVHPFLPILDLEDFLSVIHKPQSSNTVSLLLYHAVMFAASAYIDMRYLTAQGFSSRKAARKVYFQKVKLLYDFDWELERVAVVQSVLLMTYWYESPNDPKDVWYWLGIAISIAKTIGINRCTEGTTVLTPQKEKLWRRIWWSIYVRDRTLAIGLRRPMRVQNEDYDIRMLELEDCETNALTPELCRMLGGCSAVRDASKRQTLAKLFIALVKVCHLMTDVLATQYSVVSHKIGVTSETTVRLSPKPTGSKPSDVFRCDGELQDWYESLSGELRFFKAGGRERTNNHDGEVICVHRALLTAIYHTTSSALHRPQMMPAMPGLLITPEVRELSQRRVREGALDTTEIYRDLYAHDLIRYLPNTGVTVLLPAIIIHLMDIKSFEGDDKQTSMRNFQFCMQALQRLRDLYSSADFAFAFLDATIKRTEFTDKGAAKLMRSETATKAVTARRATTSDIKDPALTPPPELYNDGSTYVDQSILNSSSHARFDAMTPPSPARTSSFHNNSGFSISLKDLENFIGLDDTEHDEHELSVLLPTALQDLHSVSLDDSADVFQPTVGAACGTSVGFDGLPEVSNEPDLFVPNQVSIDDSLFKDIDMEWLADTTEDDSDQLNSTGQSVHPDSEMFCSSHSGVEQVVTPPDSAIALSRDGSLGSPDHKHYSKSLMTGRETPVSDTSESILKSELSGEATRSSLPTITV